MIRDAAVADAIAHAELKLGVLILMIGQSKDDDYGRLVGDDAARRTDAIYVAVPDVDGAHDRAKAKGATIEMALHDTDYGSREFTCRDPEGNLWSLGTYWPKVASDPAL